MNDEPTDLGAAVAALVLGWLGMKLSRAILTQRRIDAAAESFGRDLEAALSVAAREARWLR